MKKIFHMYHETSVYRTKKHPSKNRNKLAISIGYLGVHEQLSQKRGSLKSTKFPFRYLRCILLFKSYPILNCALGGEAREKTFDPPCFIRVSHRLGKQNDSAQSLPVVVLYLPPCWKKTTNRQQSKRIKKTRCVHDAQNKSKKRGDGRRNALIHGLTFDRRFANYLFLAKLLWIC